MSSTILHDSGLTGLTGLTGLPGLARDSLDGRAADADADAAQGNGNGGSAETGGRAAFYSKADFSVDTSAESLEPTYLALRERVRYALQLPL